MSDGDLRISGFRGSKTRPPGIPGFRESRGLRRRRSGNSGPRGSGISSIRAVVFPLSLMRQVVSATCPSFLFPDLPAPLYSGILRSENRRSGGDSRLARVWDFVFSRILFRPVASHRPPVPFLCLADRCGGVIFATAVRVLSCETRARVNAVPRNSALYHAPTRCLVASLSPYPARLRPTG